MKSVARNIGLAAAGIMLILALYVAIALVLAAVPRNLDFVESHDGIPVYVRTNGVHAELILPTRSPAFDWSAEFPAVHMRALAAPTEWVAFGWGDRGFMLNTPTWSDLDPKTAVVALSGLGAGAMHVEYIETPTAYKSRRIRISAAEYERLVAYIRASFVRDTDGRVRQIDAPGYFETDAFYEAVPTYTFWYTCNEWTRRALVATGIRTAMWAPFDTAVLYHLPDASKAR
jgi:uncharacterized protein (TIGR02117 family)